MSKRSRRGIEKNYSGKQDCMAEDLDTLSELQEFKRKISPALKAMIDRNAPPDEILATVQSLAAARLGTMVMTEKDSRRLLGVIQEILNRTVGKPVETVVTEHKFGKLKPEQVDALLLSKLGALKPKSSDDKDKTDKDSDPH